MKLKLVVFDIRQILIQVLVFDDIQKLKYPNKNQ